MLNNTNAHRKLINKIPTLTESSVITIRELSSYDDAILLSNNEIIDMSSVNAQTKSSKFSLQLPSNKTNDIYYFQEDIFKNNYFEVKGSNFEIKYGYQQNLKYFKINYNYEKSDTLDVKLYIVEYDKKEIINIIEIIDNNEFQVLDSTNSFKVFMKLNGQGIIYNIDLNIEENYREVLNELEIKFEAEEFYNTSREIVIEEEDEGTVLKVGKNDKKHIYVSFMDNNNKFTTLPQHEVFKSLNYKRDIMTDLKIVKDDTLEVIPMLIEYDDTEKLNIKKVNLLNQEILRFKNTTENLRFVLRLSGTGEVRLKSLSLLEIEDAPESNKMNFESRKDVISLIKPKMKLSEFKVACIMDEFTFNSFKPEVNLYKISPDKWKSELLFIQPDLLFVESAWVGNDGKWNKKVAYYDEEQHAEIKSLIKFSQELNIPVVFWNKEDPVHYDRFIETAKLCDFVFTTDKGRVPQYMLDCGHKNVATLPFAAQPKNHNPIRIQEERDPRVSFAGSYYRHHEERSKDMDILLEASKEIGLVIYDRNYEKTSMGQMPNHMYPKRFLPYVKGSLPFNLIDKSYKGYKFMINVNTVKRSETMFSRRVFEGLISGTPIISTYSLGMKMMFGDTIESSNNIDDLKKHLLNLSGNQEKYNKFALKGIREVLLNHTYEHRMKEILSAIDYGVISTKVNVYFVAVIEDDNEIEQFLNIFERQTVDNKKLVIIHKNINDYKNFYNNYNTKDIIGIDYQVLKKYTNIRQFLGDGFILTLNKNHYYGENYALDLVLSKEYSEADVIGKAMYYSFKDTNIQVIGNSKDYIYTNDIKIDRSAIKVGVFDKFSVTDALEYLEDKKSLSKLVPFGAKLFSADSLNFLENGEKTKEVEKVKI